MNFFFICFNNILPTYLFFSRFFFFNDDPIKFLISTGLSFYFCPQHVLLFDSPLTTFLLHSVNFFVYLIKISPGLPGFFLALPRAVP